MKRTTYTIAEYIQMISKLTYGDQKKEKRLSKKLLTLALDAQDHYAIAFSYLHLCQSCMELGDFHASLDYAWKGLDVQQKFQYTDLLMIQYNVLGILLAGQGDEQYALQFYHCALELATEKNEYLRISTTTNNIAILFAELKDYSSALGYLHTSLRCNKLAKKQNPENVFPMEIVYINLASTYCLRGRFSTALRYLDRCCRYLAGNILPIYEANIESIRAQAYLGLGRTEDAYASASRATDCYLSTMSLLEAFSAYIELAGIFIKLKKYEEAKTILDRCASFSGLEELPPRQLELCRTYIDLYSAISDTEKLNHFYGQYYFWQERQNEVQNSIRIASLKTRLYLEKLERERDSIKQENTTLLTLSQKDELTGIYNRHGLNQLIDTIFLPALSKRHHFGLIMVDCDFFKEYNDTYGHLAGDQCLCSIAKMLTETVGDLGCAVRYGGDEFCLLCKNLDDETIQALAAQICEKARTQIISLSDSDTATISLSLGVVNCIPPETSHFFDYFHTADMMLYEAKNSAKGTYRFTNTLK